MTFLFWWTILSLLMYPLFAVIDIVSVAISKAQIESQVQLLQTSDVQALIMAQQELIESLTELVHEYETKNDAVMAELHSMHEVIDILLKKRETKQKPKYDPFDVPHPGHMRGLQGEFHA